MNQHTRIAVNAGAQYFRTITNVILGFFSTRLVLEALGDSNFGLYALIAGLVSLLSFITNAMSTTSQRFLSYHHGLNDLSLIKNIFGNIFFLHAILSILVLIILEITGLFLFDGFLNIEVGQINAAKITYRCAIFMVLCSFMASPFRGLLISHQNLVYTSIVDVCDGILKLLIAIIVLYIDNSSNVLVQYAILMTSISVFNILALSAFCFYNYKECRLPRISEWDSKVILRIAGFASWVVYSTCMILGRSQGVAVVLNKFFGTIVNTAYGIAAQINGACIFISGSILNAFNPQIIKSEGEKKHDSAIVYAKSASKLCYLMMLMAVMPLCFYMETILKLWLGSVPPYSVDLCRIIILTTLSDQLTTGLSVINKAVGKLRFYALTVDTIKILTVPLIAVLLYFNVPLTIAFSGYLLCELISALLRLPVVRKELSFSIKDWCNNVLAKLLFVTALLACYYWAISAIFRDNIVVTVSLILSGCLLASVISYFIVLNTDEKRIFKGLMHTLLAKIIKR